MAKDNVVFLGCGDVGPIHEPMEAYSTLVRPVPATGDIRFCQCERIYSEQGSPQVHGQNTRRLKPHMASVFTDCGFNVVSLAGNHAMDWGGDALLDTIAVLRQQGIQTVGAGRNLEEARQPAIVERNGVRVAILGYCSVLREGYAAGPSSAGAAPLCASSSYQQLEYQAGVPPRVVTIPYEEDLAGVLEDIANAKKLAHAVVISVHWGVHFIPRLIAEYQLIVAKAIFEAGADLILGHHAHVPKAIGVHSGKVCFYSLSNFIMTSRMTAASAKHYGLAIDADMTVARTKRYGLTKDADKGPQLVVKDVSRSLIAKAELTRAGVRKVSFLPVQIDEQFRPEVLREGDPRFEEAVNFMDWVSEDFNHKFTVEGGEVIVSGV